MKTYRSTPFSSTGGLVAILALLIAVASADEAEVTSVVAPEECDYLSISQYGINGRGYANQAAAIDASNSILAGGFPGLFLGSVAGAGPEIYVGGGMVSGHLVLAMPAPSSDQNLALVDDDWTLSNFISEQKGEFHFKISITSRRYYKEQGTESVVFSRKGYGRLHIPDEITLVFIGSETIEATEPTIEVGVILTEVEPSGSN